MVSLLEQHGITEPTPVQEQIIPAIFEGRDVLAQSETGSGKTLSFAIPVIEQLNRRDGLKALVLVPTRELCVQVSGEFEKFSRGKHLGITSVYGGVSINTQIKKIKTTNIIVATPGRLIDLLDRKAVHLDTIQFLVFDEADRMLDMGFIKDIERILRHMQQKRQTLLFSATISKEIADLSRKYLTDAVHVRLESGVKEEFLHQTYYQTTQDLKLPLLIHLLKHERDLALVFCNRKHFAAKLAKKLSAQGILAKSLHGDLSQAQRERVTNDFRHKRFSVLIATDVAARGLHIEDITHVYNYEIPRDVESYTHRVGRTARAGKSGEAISLVASSDEQKFFKQILFTYRGSITLKVLSDVKLTPLETREHSGPEKKHRQNDHRPGIRRHEPQRRGNRRNDEQRDGNERDERRGNRLHDEPQDGTQRDGNQRGGNRRQNEQRDGNRQDDNQRRGNRRIDNRRNDNRRNDNRRRDDQRDDNKRRDDQRQDSGQQKDQSQDRRPKKKGSWKEKWQDLMRKRREGR
ncbi:MAG TPA: DEAD/DEAH box helicase [Bacteroidota bacterium]|jgi:ATP-dependent RNA helicase DeaD|nr:DEAD/DEAH box helicase [Bacteroidota bacterium]